MIIFNLFNFRKDIKMLHFSSNISQLSDSLSNVSEELDKLTIEWVINNLLPALIILYSLTSFYIGCFIMFVQTVHTSRARQTAERKVFYRFTIVGIIIEVLIEKDERQCVTRGYRSATYRTATKNNTRAVSGQKWRVKLNLHCYFSLFYRTTLINLQLNHTAHNLAVRNALSFVNSL